MKELKYLIWLAMVFGSSSGTLWQIIRSYDTVYQAYSGLINNSCPVSLSENQKNNINKISAEKAGEIISYCSDNDIFIIPYTSPEYPESLLKISNPPPVLYVQGDISCLSGGKNITCIGTRKPSEYTKKIISMICTGLVKNNFTIVSGFAMGCDIKAHMSAVGAGGKTACILGCGIDINYPVPNQLYRKSIIESGGVFISEFLPSTPAFSRNFPQRNRILSALSRATIVFEAAGKSGSLSTAGLVKSQNRKLFCIPPADISDSRYAGNIHLIRTSATPLYSVGDVLEFYGEPEKISVRKTEIKPQNHEKLNIISEPEFTPLQQKILSAFGNNDVIHMDTLIDRLDMDISEIITEIMELRMSGIIEELTGNRYRKTERGKI
ncbi:MAG: DNA-processing protein DprA [Prevotella sp.]|nr:DNA-processing protein DprA [Alistipes senegalensis]MCM1357420.1 DNA-processing protein DprA [Prevotella sp.]MCM1473971.1 DNA-processing protein DprA [Muribaculaceae bacterium]